MTLLAQLASEAEVLLKRRYALGELTDVVMNIATHLRQHLAGWGMFVLLLRGELGSGKTTTIRHLLYELGLDRQVAVVSPTYTYACSYPSHYGTIMHVDLYRCGGHMDAMNIAMAGSEESTAGWIIEWPQMMGEELAMLLRFKLTATAVFELVFDYVNPHSVAAHQDTLTTECSCDPSRSVAAGSLMAGDDKLRDITFLRRHFKS